MSQRLSAMAAQRMDRPLDRYTSCSVPGQERLVLGLPHGQDVALKIELGDLLHKIQLQKSRLLYQ